MLNQLIQDYRNENQRCSERITDLQAKLRKTTDRSARKYVERQADERHHVSSKKSLLQHSQGIRQQNPPT